MRQPSLRAARDPCGAWQIWLRYVALADRPKEKLVRLYAVLSAISPYKEQQNSPECFPVDLILLG